jgi:hypothetical protein
VKSASNRVKLFFVQEGDIFFSASPFVEPILNITQRVADLYKKTFSPAYIFFRICAFWGVVFEADVFHEVYEYRHIFAKQNEARLVLRLLLPTTLQRSTLDFAGLGWLTGLLAVADVSLFLPSLGWTEVHFSKGGTSTSIVTLLFSFHIVYFSSQSIPQFDVTEDHA